MSRESEAVWFYDLMSCCKVKSAEHVMSSESITTYFHHVYRLFITDVERNLAMSHESLISLSFS